MTTTNQISGKFTFGEEVRVTTSGRRGFILESEPVIERGRTYYSVELYPTEREYGSTRLVHIDCISRA